MPEQTKPDLLDEKRVAEIEKRHKLAQSGFQPYMEVDSSLADIPALCAAVRALQRKLELEAVAADKFKRLAEGEVTRLREQLAAVEAERDEARQHFTRQTERLAQVEKDRDYWKERCFRVNKGLQP